VYVWWWLIETSCWSSRIWISRIRGSISAAAVLICSQRNILIGVLSFLFWLPSSKYWFLIRLKSHSSNIYFDASIACSYLVIWYESSSRLVKEISLQVLVLFLRKLSDCSWKLKGLRQRGFQTRQLAFFRSSLSFFLGYCNEELFAGIDQKVWQSVMDPVESQLRLVMSAIDGCLQLVQLFRVLQLPSSLVIFNMCLLNLLWRRKWASRFLHPIHLSNEVKIEFSFLGSQFCHGTIVIRIGVC